MNIEALAAKHSQDYPGYQLVDFYEAAFPSYVVQLRVLMQRQRPLTVVEEFVLRSVDVGQETIEEVAGLLGLDWPVVEASLDILQRRGYVLLVTKRTNGIHEVRINLTNKGRSALSELVLLEPELTNFSVCLDSLTGQLYPSRPLMQPKAVRDAGLHEVPTFLPIPLQERLDFMTLKRLVREGQRDLPIKTERRELSEILSVEKSWTAYRPMRILQYVRPDDHAIQIEVFDGSERSLGHESVLLQMEADMYRPLRSFTNAEVPPVDPSELAIIDPRELNAARRDAVESPKLRAEISEKREAIGQAETQLGSRVVIERQGAAHKIELLKQQLAEREERLSLLEAERGSTEVLQMHEHRPKLLEAVRSAKEQLIIISPWLNSHAVDYELRQEIGQALKRGITILIGYGFSEPDQNEARTIKSLQKVAAGKRGMIKFYRVGDVHSKVLICDDQFMIMGSFNWLSFAGDPMRGSRVEDGILTRDKKAISMKTQEWMERLTAIGAS